MKRCLLICPIGIGNYLLAYPAFYQLKKNFPGTDFFLLALRSGIGAFAETDPLFKQVLVMEPEKNKSIARKLGWINKIRSLHCDTAISFFPSNRFEYNALLAVSGARIRCAFQYKTGKFRTGRFLANRLIPVNESLHDIQQNLQVLPALGALIQEPIVFPRLFNETDVQEARKWITENGLKGKRLLGMHPGSSAEHGMIAKRWPEQSFGQLAKMMADLYEYTVLVFGGREENTVKHTVSALAAPHAKSVDNLPLGMTAALIAQCKAFVSNDSGLMHFAALSGVPTAGIFGPTADSRTAPWGEKNLIIRRELDCAPCWTVANVGRRQSCGEKGNRCLSDFSAMDVFRKIQPWHSKLFQN